MSTIRRRAEGQGGAAEPPFLGTTEVNRCQPDAAQCTPKSIAYQHCIFSENVAPMSKRVEAHSEKFTKIERSLERIERKLNGKAD